MEVELLYWEGCPSHPAALADLRAALGFGVAVVVREIESEEQARAEDFPGSPTIRVDGADLFPIAEPPSLSCRIYRLADGRFSPTPDPLLLRDALARAGLSTIAARRPAMTAPGEAVVGRATPWGRP